jgi:Flp pilus assembly protein TadD
MSKVLAEQLFALGIEALKEGQGAVALEQLEKAVSLERTPLYCSTLALCLAKEKRDFKRAVSLCKEAIKNDPKKSVHFLNLGKVYLVAGQKKDAIRTLNMGLRYGNDREIINELKRFGLRRAPVIPFLSRDNSLNVALGKLLSRWGLR